MLNRICRAPRKIINTLRWVLKPNKYLVLQWATEGVIAKNWGDKLNRYLAEKISGRRIMHRAEVYPVPGKKIHFWIGSHLATALSQKDSVIWGAGFISANIPFETTNNADIRAVRGWLSHGRLKDKGIKVPDVVGDAALLLPRLYTPKTTKKYALGVIPHCFEWDEPFFINAQNWGDDVLVIDITGGIEEVVDQITSCKQILSSSLHGIICADSYGVPALWVHASDKPKGDGFKFLDYFSSVDRPDKKPIKVDGSSSRSELENCFFDYSISIDLEKLWQACPVISSR